MKKILVFIIGISILFFSCNNKENNRYMNEIGIITSIDTNNIYNPVIQRYDNIYKYNIVVNDTNIVIHMKVEYKIGDTIPLIKYE